TRDVRFSGTTNYTFMNYISHALRLIFAFSFKPLEWISYLASAVTVLAGIGLIIYLILAVTTELPRGWPTLVVAILFLGAIQLFCISIIGEYIGRIYQEVKRRPHAIVRDVINGPNEPPTL
ncbi:MAG: glycosyltransferase, partial [Patescibacteria group bacterium]